MIGLQERNGEKPNDPYRIIPVHNIAIQIVIRFAIMTLNEARRAIRIGLTTCERRGGDGFAEEWRTL